jgi:hypothetical protein
MLYESFATEAVMLAVWPAEMVEAELVTVTVMEDPLELPEPEPEL